MSRESITEAIIEAGIIAIVRADCSVDKIVAAIGAVLEGGICCIEVTMTTPDALECIESAAHEFAGSLLLLGVGSVTDVEDCDAAIDAGAEFVVCPVISPPVIDAAHERDKAVLPGAFTPTEIFQAWHFGGDIIKVFPAGFGGVEYIRTVRAPLPYIPLAPTGGVNTDNVGEFIHAGAVALGVGSNLVNKALVEAGDLKALTRNAQAFQQALRVARGDI